MWGTSRVHDATSERRHHKHAHLKVAGQKHIVDIKPVHLLHQLRGAYAYPRTMRIARAQSMRSAGTYIFIETSLLCAPPGMFAPLQHFQRGVSIHPNSGAGTHGHPHCVYVGPTHPPRHAWVGSAAWRCRGPPRTPSLRIRACRSPPAAFVAAAPHSSTHRLFVLGLGFGGGRHDDSVQQHHQTRRIRSSRCAPACVAPTTPAVGWGSKGDWRRLRTAT